MNSTMRLRVLITTAAVIMLHVCTARAARSAEDPTWRQTVALPAAEAHQAAAASKDFVFAISSTVVAKYDRGTGEHLETSTGDAKHLNSGFLMDGRLYCAHSNYPRTPERSEIKVLDVESMRLETFQDFGNFGGSLTWCVHRGGFWWCNFARYGDRNAETFLVRFDPDWKEQGRWTYPSEVTDKLGRYSISGGVWRGDSLLVTGHDDPVLFELRLPDSGDVLQYVRTHAVPFSGQGIAHDSVSGGLVGIRRSRKQIVFASFQAAGPQRLRMLTYNIHHGQGVDERLDLERIASVITSSQPDIVALQEVDKEVRRSGTVDQPTELAKLTKMEGVFGANIELQGGEYGNAVLSRYPIRRHKNHLLPRFDESEQRGVLEVEIAVPGLETPLLLFATHMDHRRDDRERLASAEFINGLAEKQRNRPALLAGDLNAVPESKVLSAFAKQWTSANETPLPTIPVESPERQIDYVLFRPAANWKVVETKVIDEAVASDHRPLLSVLELTAQGK